MRLLQLNESGEVSLTEHVGSKIPPYAILSHTWGSSTDEVSFADLVLGRGTTKSGYNKLKFCGQQAARDGLEFFWVDTCCIDKTSSAELSEAINSMYRWYLNAVKCYVYLADVSSSPGKGVPFRKSRWFTRGWTLQELLAPSNVEFYTAEGDFLFTKLSRVDEISDITDIPFQALLHQSNLSGFTIRERTRWARGRETTREEDIAYSLLGIFDIHMPLIYGEGKEKALNRLHKEVMLSLDDTKSSEIYEWLSESDREPTPAGPKIAIVYYSMYGHVKALANAELQGIRDAGGDATVFQVEETLPDEILSRMFAPPKAVDVAVLHDPAQLEEFDGILFGIPTRYGNLPAQYKTFWDKSGKQWAEGSFCGKYAGLFISTATLGGGQESTAIASMSTLAHHGFIYVPLGYKNTFAELANVTEVHGGSPWGAGTFSGADGSREPSPLEIQIATAQGRAFYEIVARACKVSDEKD